MHTRLAIGCVLFVSGCAPSFTHHVTPRISDPDLSTKMVSVDAITPVPRTDDAILQGDPDSSTVSTPNVTVRPAVGARVELGFRLTAPAVDAKVLLLHDGAIDIAIDPRVQWFARWWDCCSADGSHDIRSGLAFDAPFLASIALDRYVTLMAIGGLAAARRFASAPAHGWLEVGLGLLVQERVGGSLEILALIPSRRDDPLTINGGIALTFDLPTGRRTPPP